MKLYFAPGACSLSPHIVLRELGLPFTTEKVDTKTKLTATGANFREINPKGYVPALEMDDGALLTEGPAIVQFLADKAPEKKLVPAPGSLERYRVQEMLNFITSEIHKSFSPLFNPAYPEDGKKINAEKIAQRFDLLEARLSKGGPYLFGEQFTVADAYLFTVLGWGRWTGIDIARWPALKAYHARVAERPAVQEALKAEGLK